MKHYLIHYVRLHGEFEDGDKFLLEAADKKEAKTLAKEIIKNDMGDTTDEWDGDELDCFDYAILLDEVTEIPEAHAKILEKYL